MTNYKLARADVAYHINNKAEIPLHQGTCDVTEIIDFQSIAEFHGLFCRQYERLINWPELSPLILSE